MHCSKIWRVCQVYAIRFNEIRLCDAILFCYNNTKIIEKRGDAVDKRLKEKIVESFRSVLPITAVVFLISITIAPLETGSLTMFLCGAVMLILGMGLFQLGVDMAMMPMGEGMGVGITKSKKLWLVAVLCFAIGAVVTIAEPDLTVLANQVPSIPNPVLILTVAVGVGLFLVVALLRILFQIKLLHMLWVSYILVFVMAIFVPNEFIAVAFDSGGVTTGPITVPFIMALGIGMASIRSSGSQDDSFGLVALCSVGPILAVMLLGIVYHAAEAYFTPVVVPDVNTTQDAAMQFAQGLPAYLEEVAIALLPIIGMFVLYQLISRRFRGKALGRVIIGVLYTYAGLVLFLTGVNVGFMPVGYFIGGEVAASNLKWLLIPIGMLIGYFIVTAEPAVHVLNKQVEEISAGAISAKSMNLSLSLGVAVSVGIAMLRVLMGIPIYYFLVPGYAIALVLGYIESFIPITQGIPGVKLGLSNTVLLYALYVSGSAAGAWLLMVLKVVLSGLLYAGVQAMIYSFAGGILSLLVMMLIKRVPGVSIVGVSICGAVAHNVGQIVAASLVVTLPALVLLRYFGILLVCALVTGLLTGIVAKSVFKALAAGGVLKSDPTVSPAKKKKEAQKSASGQADAAEEKAPQSAQPADLPKKESDPS